MGGIYYNIIGENEVEVTYRDYNYNSYPDIADIIVLDKVVYDDVTYNVTAIGDGAFIDCVSLITVSLPFGITSIGQGAFNGCTSLTTINIPASVTSVGESALVNCIALKNVNIEDLGAWSNLSGRAAIQYVYGASHSINLYVDGEIVKDIDLPASVTEIPDGLFRYFETMKTLSIPLGVTAIGRQAFDGCLSLEKISFAGTLDEWYDIHKGEKWMGETPLVHCTDGEIELFYNDYKITLSDGTIKDVNWISFDDKQNVVSCQINDYVEYISDTFRGFTSLVSVDIPKSVTFIGNSAFDGCTSLNSVEIPGSVTSIGIYAFSG